MKPGLAEIVEHYVRELAGDHSDQAWQSLVEFGPEALPCVVQAFALAYDRSVAASLIRVVNEYRTPSALPFLMSLLADPDQLIWKTALDGIVTLGGRAALDSLLEIRATLSPEKHPWIDEAVGQVRT